ncbi:hypothetical protein [Luteimonas aquatica]|uniref:hypothetical protein n=1 Tax=Luteimonas aquatica TaxID=450364 RepID=UPI001F5A61BD|nr:hypothetical protein [Luteimonas aquatica]
MFRTALRRSIVALLALGLAACASSALVTGRPRPPIDPAQVQVYFSPPPGQYEEIAMLESKSGAFTYGEQNKMDSVVGKLRKEAAKLGANGVLFRGTADGYGGGGVSVGGGGGRIGGHGYGGAGVGIDITPRQKFARGIAIYVANPPPPSAPPAR